MKPQETVKPHKIAKAETAGTRLPVKKMYCFKCQRLVKGQPQGSKSTLQVVCPRCSQPLWVWKGLAWKCATRDGVSR